MLWVCGIRNCSGLRILTSGHCPGILAWTSFAANRPGITYTTGTELLDYRARAAWREVVAFCLGLCAQFEV